MKLAIYQMADRGDPEDNLAKAYEAIMNNLKADFFILPEFFVFPGADYKRNYTLAEAYRETGRPGEEMLEKASLSFPGYLVGGTLIEETPEGYYNTCYVLKGGKRVARYRKINLTEEELDMQLLPGKETVVFDTEWGKAGLLVCFDVIIKQTREQVGKVSDFVLLPVGMTVPDHPKADGHPLCEEMAEKFNVMVAKVSRVGFYDGQPLVSRSAVVAPSGLVWEASEAGEDLALVEVAIDPAGK